MKTTGSLIPEWLAYASHDFHGDDLRRRWDDDEQLDFVDGHPVVYSGAGSHASYFRKGEYQAEANLALPTWVQFLRGAWNKFWIRGARAGTGGPVPHPVRRLRTRRRLERRRGRIADWAPVLIDESTPWVSRYRGLWGLFARDPDLRRERTGRSNV